MVLFLISVVGVAGTLAGIVIMVILRHRSPHHLVIQYSHTPLIDMISRHGDLRDAGVQVIHDDVQLTKLSRTAIVIWNRGPRSLIYDSHVKSGPLTIFFEDEARIIQWGILKTTREGNPTEIEIQRVSEHALSLEFTHLDKKDGALIFVLHESQYGTPRIGGSVVDQSVACENEGEIGFGEFKSQARLQIAGSVWAIVLAFGLALQSFGPIVGPIVGVDFLGQAGATVMWVSVTLAAFLALYGWRTLSRRFPRVLRPS